MTPREKKLSNSRILQQLPLLEKKLGTIYFYFPRIRFSLIMQTTCVYVCPDKVTALPGNVAHHWWIIESCCYILKLRRDESQTFGDNYDSYERILWDTAKLIPSSPILRYEKTVFIYLSEPWTRRIRFFVNIITEREKYF